MIEAADKLVSEFAGLTASASPGILYFIIENYAVPIKHSHYIK